MKRKPEARQRGGGERTPQRVSVRRAIRDAITSGELAAGARVNESWLAQELAISRTPIREALFNLEKEGFVMSAGRGFTVAPVSGRDVREIYPMIWTLEGLALRSSLPFMRPLLPKLKKINASLGETRSTRRALELDTQWHTMLISLCQNRRLLSAITDLRTAAMRYELMFMRESDLIAISVEHHDNVIEALERNDGDAAVKALEANWEFGMRALLIAFGEH